MKIENENGGDWETYNENERWEDYNNIIIIIIRILLIKNEIKCKKK
jgi:hypothetical protein